MKNLIRWGLFLAGIVGLFLVMYFLVLPSWPFYALAGWQAHHYGPRIFPGLSFLGLAILVGVGFVLFMVLLRPSRDKSSTDEEKEDFCPYCGREFQGSETKLGDSPETHGPEAIRKGKEVKG